LYDPATLSVRAATRFSDAGARMSVCRHTRFLASVLMLGLPIARPAVGAGIEVELAATEVVATHCWSRRAQHYVPVPARP
jgi:hypothetical protein